MVMSTVSGCQTVMVTESVEVQPLGLVAVT